MRMRPYQTAALEAIASRPHARGIVACPTGTGKSAIGSRIPQALGVESALYLAHREELIDQLVTALHRAGHPDVGVEMAGSRAPDFVPIVVASVPTLAASKGRRLKAMPPGRFGVVVVDECHHACADSYLSIWQHFGMLDDSKRKTLAPSVPLLGLTATPGRGDGVGLHNVFDGVTYRLALKDAIEGGWLVPLRAYTVETHANLDNVRTRMGEYVEKDLALAVATGERNAAVVDAYRRDARGLRSLVFCVDREHARTMAEAFAADGFPAQWIDGTLPSDQRAARFAWFRDTPGAILTNCQIVTEGTDVPSIECVIMAAPTKSATNYMQRLGRGLRLAEGAYDFTESVERGKHECILLDVTDSTSRVGARAVNVMDIFGAPLPTERLAGGNVLETVKAQQQSLDLRGSVGTSSHRVDLFAATPDPPGYCKLRWLVLGAKSYRLGLPDRKAIRVESDVLDRWIVETFDPESKAWKAQGDPCDTERDALLAAEVMAMQVAPGAFALAAKSARWHGDEPSEKQIALCATFRIPIPVGATKGDVSKALDRYFANKRRQ